MAALSNLLLVEPRRQRQRQRQQKCRRWRRMEDWWWSTKQTCEGLWSALFWAVGVWLQLQGGVGWGGATAAAACLFLPPLTNPTFTRCKIFLWQADDKGGYFVKYYFISTLDECLEAKTRSGDTRPTKSPKEKNPPTTPVRHSIPGYHSSSPSPHFHLQALGHRVEVHVGRVEVDDGAIRSRHGRHLDRRLRGLTLVCTHVPLANLSTPVLFRQRETYSEGW